MTLSVPLEVEGLERRFGSRRVLRGVSFRLEQGQLMALLGPNGAGKTTLLKILAGLLRPHQGTVRVFGLNPFRDRARVMERTRFAFAPVPLYLNLTVREHLQFLARLQGDLAPGALEEVLGRVGLLERADERVRTLSTGLRQRLGLAQALLPEPQLLILDEPAEGLDPLALLELREILRTLCRERGLAVLLSSHLLLEVEELADRLLVLQEGSPVFWGAPEQLQEDTELFRIVVEEPEEAARLFRGLGYPIRRADHSVFLPAREISLEEALEVLSPAGIRIQEFHRVRPSLKKALLHRLGKDQVSGDAPQGWWESGHAGQV